MNKSDALEPGLLSVFQLAVGVQIAFGLILFFPILWREEPQLALRLIIRLVLQIVLLAYLYMPEDLRQMIPYYLPLGLILASLELLIAQVASLLISPPADMSIGDALQFESGGMVLVLLVPVVVIAWQYRFRTVLTFCIATCLVPLLTYVLAFGVDVLDDNFLTEFSFFRGVIYLVMGYLIVRLVDGQRQQKQALARANQKLAQYASSLEQLTVVRERSRMARELHDTLAHAQSGIAVQLEGVDALWEANPNRARELLQQATKSIRGSMEETRRALQSLRASPLEEYGLLLALHELANQMGQQGKFAIDLNLPEYLLGLDTSIEQMVYRVTQEALLNVVRHAAAKHVSITLVHHEKMLTLSISDNGQGFQIDNTDSDRSFGIKGMQERVELMGGQLAILSSPGKGTIVRLTVEV
jgi:signal transduction histidine kinase